MFLTCFTLIYLSGKMPRNLRCPIIIFCGYISKDGTKTSSFEIFCWFARGISRNWIRQFCFLFRHDQHTLKSLSSCNDLHLLALWDLWSSRFWFLRWSLLYWGPNLQFTHGFHPRWPWARTGRLCEAWSLLRAWRISIGWVAWEILSHLRAILSRSTPLWIRCWWFS